MKRKRAAILPTNIALLQNLVRRGPESYHEEFLQQYSHYESLRDIYLLNPSSDDGEDFEELIGFVSAVCSCYPTETANFPEELKLILLNNHRDLSPQLREKIIQCLIMLRNKGVINPEFLIQSIFPLLTAYSPNNEDNVGVHAKALRRQVYSALITLLKAVNTGTKNVKLNRSTQALLFNLLEQKDGNGLWATKLTRELWRRGIWDDSRTVEIMTQASIHPDAKVVVSGVKFFLGADKEREEAFQENSDDEDEIDTSGLRHKMLMNKKSSKRGKKLEAAVKAVKKKNNSRISATYLNFSAIHLLRDPQQFAEALFDQHLTSKNSNKFDLDQKIAIMNLISRLVGTHKLTVLGLYSFFLKYLTPKQRNVTQVMAAAAQATHDLVPPETINMVIRKITDEFVSEGVAAEVAAAGINTIREILSRSPTAIDETLLQDLTEYKGSKSKPVVVAARSLISLYREVAPEMLSKKDRGKTATMEIIHGERDNSGQQFGVDGSNVTGIPGLELLIKWKMEQGLLGKENEEDWKLPDSDEEDLGADIDGEWVNVEEGKEYNVSDAEGGEDGDESLEDKLKRSGIKKKYAKYMKKSKKKEDEENDSDLELSDDDEEAGEGDSERPRKKSKKNNNDSTEEEKKAIAEAMSTAVLTPADFAKLKELQQQAGIEKYLGHKLNNEAEVDSTTLVGSSKYKQNKEERLAHVREGREDREKFSSRKGKRENAHSTTNREKARKKNFVMMIHKRSVQGKQKMSLRDRQKVLRAHIDKQKKGK